MTAASASFAAMGTVALVRVEADDPRPALAAARRVITGLERELSRFLPDSDVGRINRSAGRWVEVGPDAAALAARCVELARRTRGAFNPLLGDAVAAWREAAGTGRIPGVPAAVADPDALEVDGDRVRIPPSCSLDLGAVGKGYAADVAVAACLAEGAGRALVSIGTSSIAVGPDQALPAVVQVDSPFAECLPLGHLSFVGSLSVSGGRGIARGAGSIASHIIDPATMRPALTDVACAAVVGSDGVEAEAFSTALVVLGAERALRLGIDDQLSLVLATVDGRVLASPAIAADLRLSPGFRP